MRHTLFLGVAAAALFAPAAAFAQSTGTVDAENSTADVVVTGSRRQGVEGFQTPDTPKAKAVITQEQIAKQVPGQSILDTINQVPGVSFQNNDPFGSAGGTLTIRGFDSTRISLTFDGIPLNDTGNYALYSNQQLDPELIEQVNVNLGSTDIDSPTAAASGSTVNYRTINPTDEFGARMVGSVGDFQFFRVFGLVNTGVFTPFGTKAWFSGSHAENNNVYGGVGVIDKQQYNAKIYQPIGSNGDFVAISGNYNQNRNNFFGSVPLRNDRTQTATSTTPRVVGGASGNRFPATKDERYYKIARCQIDTPQTGVADVPNSCGTSFEERFNPSNTGNIRINSRFTLADGVTLYLDPSYQYTKANGGGTATAREGARDINPSTTVTTNRFGYFGGSPYAGIDLNGDGDLLDQVSVLAPSQTQTHRYGLIGSLRYEFSDTQSVRVGYSYDRGRHRQTGEVGFLRTNGKPFDVFPVNDPIVAANGVTLQKRDRLSYAILNQVFGEYRGEFFDGALTVTAGVTGKFFKRDLNQYCFTSSAGGFVECYGRDATLQSDLAAANPYTINATTGVPTGFAPPQERVLKYNRALPSAGLTYKFDNGVSFYGSYSKGIQVPGTDNLYNSFFFPVGTAQAKPRPETTDNFDAGLRYTSSKLQVQVGPWYTRFKDRLASAYDPDLDVTVFRNLGTVDKYGFDGQIDVRPIPEVFVHLFGSYLKSKIKDDVQLGACTNTTSPGCTAIGQPIFGNTSGQREAGAPVFTFGGRIQATLGPLEFGVQAKRTGKRYVNDQNIGVFQCALATGASVNASNNACPAGSTTYQVYGASTPAYTLVDLDARLALDWIGLNDRTYFQFNLVNAFDKLYVGGFGGNTSAFNIPNSQIGSPRAFIATLNVGF